MVARTSWIPTGMLPPFYMTEYVAQIAEDPTATEDGTPITVELTINQAGGYGGILTKVEEPGD